jgi:hypothetical protein
LVGLVGGVIACGTAASAGAASIGAGAASIGGGAAASIGAGGRTVAALPGVGVLAAGALLRGTSSYAPTPIAPAPSAPTTTHFARDGRGLAGANSSADTTVPFHAMLRSLGAIGGGFGVTATTWLSDSG